MAEFIFAYHGGNPPESEEAGAAMMEKWKEWVAGLGAVAVNPGTPVGMSKTVGPDGVTDDGGSNPLMGFSVIAADSIEAAVEIAKGCPHIDLMQGTIEVAELKQMG